MEKSEFVERLLIFVAYTTLLIYYLGILGLIISVFTIIVGLFIWSYLEDISIKIEIIRKILHERKSKIFKAIIIGIPITITIIIASGSLLIYEELKDYSNPNRVVFDETRLNEMPKGGHDNQISETEWYGGSDFTDLLKENGFNVSRIFIEPITYEKLKEYDVLILLSPDGIYSVNEIEAIKKFVNNGGGLLLAVDNWRGSNDDYTANRIAMEFGLNFSANGMINDDKNHYGNEKEERVIPKISDIKTYFETEKITRGVSSFYIDTGTYIINGSSETNINILAYSSGNAWFDKFRDGWGNNIKESDEVSGPFPILATMSYGKGKIIFIGDGSFLINKMIKSDADNGLLGLNIVKWLAVKYRFSVGPATIDPRAYEKIFNLFKY